MNGFGLSRERFALLFSVMLVAAAGNTAMQSLLPAIGRDLHVADLWVAAAFSLSALVWVAMAPVWAHRADRRGRRALMRLGLTGFIVSTLICGGALAAGLAGLAGGHLVFAIFMLGRALYGALRLGLAAGGPGLYRGADRRGGAHQRRSPALASSFGLGTIIGPAIAPLFIFPPLGLASPLIAFALIGGARPGRRWRCASPTTRRSSAARGPIVAYPSIGARPMRRSPPRRSRGRRAACAGAIRACCPG